MMATRYPVLRKAVAALVPVLLLLSSFGTIAIGLTADKAPAISMSLGPLAPNTDTSSPWPRESRYLDGYEWPMLGGGPGRTHYSTSVLPADQEKAWSSTNGAPFTAGPVIFGNMLIVGLKGSSELLALNASTGDRLWNSTLDGDPSTPSVRGNVLYVGTSKGTLFGLNITNGDGLWNRTVSTAAVGPVLAFNVTVTATASNGVVRAYDPWGTELWNVTTLPGAAGPATGSGQTVMIPVADTLYAYNATDGGPKWNTAVSPSANISMASLWQGENASGPTDDRALVTASDGSVHSLWLENGTVNWTANASSLLGLAMGPRAPPTVVPNLVGVGGLVIVPVDRKLLGLNASSGSAVWNVTLDNTTTSSVVATGAGLAVGLAGGNVSVLRFQGALPPTSSWSNTADGEANVTGLGSAYGRLFALTEGGEAVVFGKRPLAHITIVEPEYGTFDAPVHFKGFGSDAATFVNYRWRSSMDGVFASGPTADNITYQLLSLGTHDIYFQVQDDNWTWSPEVRSSVTINQSTQWPMYRHDPLRTGLGLSSIPATASLKWKRDLTPGDGQDVTSSPAIVGNRVYLGTRDHYIHCINVVTGATLWSMNTGGAVDSSPAVVDDLLVFGSDDGFLYGMDPDPTDDIIDEGAPDFGEHQLHDVKWRYDAGGPVSSSPVVTGGSIYFTTAPVGGGAPKHGRLYALDMTGSKRWSFEIANPFPIYSSPAVSGDKVFFGANDGSLYSVDRATGNAAWPVPFHTSGPIVSTPTASNDSVFVGSNDGALYAVWAANGTQRWHFDTLGSTGGEVQSSPVVSGGLVFFGSRDKSFYAVHLSNGTLAWRFETKDQIVSSPTVAGDRVMFGSYDGTFYVLNITNGTVVWTSSPGVAFGESSPAVVGGLILVGATMGNLVAFGDAPDFSLYDPLSGAPDVKLVPSQPRVGVNTKIIVGVHNLGTVNGNVTLNIYSRASGSDPVHVNTIPVTVPTKGQKHVETWWGPDLPGGTFIIVNLSASVPLDLNALNDEIVFPTTVLIQSEGWRMLGNDPKHSGSVSDVFGTPNTNMTWWSYDTKGEVLTSPVVGDGRVYVASGTKLISLLEENGLDQPGGTTTKLWDVELGSVVLSTPAVANSLVFVTTTAGRLLALDSFTGEEVWNRSLAAGTSSPTVLNNTLYLGTPGGDVMALDTTTGNIVWSVKLGEAVHGSPAVSRNLVVVPADDGDGNWTLYALDARTGEHAWWFTTDASMSTAAIANSQAWDVEVVLVADSSGWVRAFELLPDQTPNIGDNTTDKGRAYDLVWSYFDNSTISSSPSVLGETVVVPSGNSSILGLDTDNGELRWRRNFATPMGTNELTGPASIGDEKLFVGADGIYCLDLVTGLQIWRKATAGWVSSSPVLSNGHVLVASSDGLLQMFNRSTNLRPSAMIDEPTNGSTFKVGQRVTFDASSSYDEDGVLREYRWDLGNDIMAEGAVIHYTYHKEDLELGPLTVKLTVVDNDDNLASTNISLFLLPNEPPVLTNGTVSPLEGNITSSFVLRVTYSDPDNDLASSVKVLLRDDLLYDAPKEYAMSPADKNNSNDTPLVGIGYIVNVTDLPSGDYGLAFRASDGVAEANLTTSIHVKVWTEETDTNLPWEITVEYIGKDAIRNEQSTLGGEKMTWEGGEYYPLGADAIRKLGLAEGSFHEMRSAIVSFNYSSVDDSWAIKGSIIMLRSQDKALWTKAENWTNDAGKERILSRSADLSGYYGVFAKKLPPNINPVANINTDKSKVEVGERLTFDALESYFFDRNDPSLQIRFKEPVMNPQDPGNPNTTLIRFVWFFGDGENLTGWNISDAKPSHVYKKAGTYIVGLVVTDPYGLSSNLTDAKIEVREKGANEMLMVLVVVIVVVVVVSLFWPTSEKKEEKVEVKRLGKEEREEAAVAEKEEVLKPKGEKEEEEEGKEKAEEGEEEKDEDEEEEEEEDEGEEDDEGTEEKEDNGKEERPAKKEKASKKKVKKKKMGGAGEDWVPSAIQRSG